MTTSPLMREDGFGAERKYRHNRVGWGDDVPRNRVSAQLSYKREAPYLSVEKFKCGQVVKL